MPTYFTSGQVARKLHVSISTVKRWIAHPELKLTEYRNYNGWRLFCDTDVDALKKYKRSVKKNGKRFKETTLIPIDVSRRNK